MHYHHGQLSRFFLRPQRMDFRAGFIFPGSHEVGYWRPPVPAALASWRHYNSGFSGPPAPGSWPAASADNLCPSGSLTDQNFNRSNTSGEILGRNFKSDNDAGVQSVTEAYRRLLFSPAPSEPSLATPNNVSMNPCRRGSLFSNAVAWWPVLPVFGYGQPALSPPSAIRGNFILNNCDSRSLVPATGYRHYIAIPGMDKKEVGRADEGNARQQSQLPRKKLKTSDDVLTKINELRQWEYTDAGQTSLTMSSPGVEFTIMSYNVLAQRLLQDNGYLYFHCDGQALSWQHRSKQLLREFRQANADILCLQEVQCDHYEDFYVPELKKLGYVGLFKKRTGNKWDGCAVFYKQRKFICDSTRSVEFCRPQMSSDLARDNIALLVTLRPRSTAGGSGRNTFCVANTHLLFNPGRGDIKLAQLRILLAEIDRTAFLPGSGSYRPILMCGDMNSEPHCPLHQFVCTGQLSYEGLTAGDVSGQHDGARRGRFQLRRELVPQGLGISDQCQYVKTLEHRQAKARYAQKSAPRTSADVLVEQWEPLAPPVFSSGSMSHNFNLVSAYNHVLNRLDGQTEVTTHHLTSSCTVDYIFYSVEEKVTSLRNKKIVHENVKEGDLTLLATYGLLGESELKRFGGLPNLFQPSDHLPLIAKFLLTTPS